MSNWLLIPPIALLIYLILVWLLHRFGRVLAPPSRPNPLKGSIYAGGEAAPTGMAAAGYRRFFIIALFFAVLHLGALVVGTVAIQAVSPAGSTPDGFLPIALVYLVGLVVSLIALILG